MRVGACPLCLASNCAVFVLPARGSKLPEQESAQQQVLEKIQGRSDLPGIAMLLRSSGDKLWLLIGVDLGVRKDPLRIILRIRQRIIRGFGGD